MDIIERNPAQVAEQNVRRSVEAPQMAPGADAPRYTPDYGIADAIVASFMRDSWIANATVNFMDDAGADADATRDNNFNPHRYIAENWDEARQNRVRAWQSNGLFDHAYSAREVERTFAAAEREEHWAQISNASGVGTVVGGLASAVMDPLSYLGIGTVMRGASVASRVGRMALQSGLSQAATETALHQIQVLRTAHESTFNVAGATLFGGGIGAFIHGVPRALRGTLEADQNAPAPHGTPETAPVARGAGGDLSAAVPDISLTAPAPGKADGLTILDRILGGFRTPFADFTSPMYRLFRSPSDVVRNIFYRLADTRGTSLADADGNVVRTPDSAENLRDILRAEWIDRWSNDVDASVRTLSQHLATQGARAMRGPDFMRTIARVITDRIDDKLGETWRAELGERYGADNVEAIVTAARERSEALHASNAAATEAMTRVGALRDVAEMDKLRQQMDALRAQRDAEVKALQQQVAIARGTAARQTGTAAEARAALPELKAQLAEARERWRAEMEPFRRELDHQKSLPEPLGRDYRFAQMYDRQAIIGKPEEFENILIDKFLSTRQVDPDWLMETHKLTPDELRVIETKDPHRFNEIQRSWVGDERMARIEKAENSLRAAEERAHLAKADAARTLEDLQLAERYLGESPEKALRELVALAENELAHVRKLPQTPENIARLQVTEARLDRLMRARNALREADGAQKSAQSSLRSIARDVARQVSLADASVRELKKHLTRANKRGGMYETIQKIMDNIRNGDALPSLDKSLGQEISSGRLRERRIHWTPEEIEKLTGAGFLRDDLGNILHHQFNDIAGQVALRETFGIGPRGKYRSWSDIDAEIVRDYTDRIAAAPEGKARANLAQSMDDDRKAIELLRRRLLHRNAPDIDRDSMGYWFAEKWRQFAYIRYGSGFGLASLVDIAAMVLNHRVGDLVQAAGRDFIPLLRGRKMSEIHNLINGSELGLQNISRARSESWIDMTGQRGVGARGTNRQRVTANIDVAMEKTSNVVAAISFLPLLTRSIKTLAASAMIDVLRREAGQFASLPLKRRHRLLGLGLDESRAARLHEHFQKYGVETNGSFDPRVELWTGAEGRAALRDFQQALHRDMNLSSPTPGIADTPALMDNWVGRMVMQFQTFAFVTHNRMLAPALQRATVSGDFRGLGMLATAIPLATLIVMARDVINGRDPAERFKPENMGQTMLDIVDRIGVLGWTKPYLDAGMRATGLTGLSRYSRNSAWESLGGIPFEQAGRVNEFISATADGDLEQMRRVGGVLSPANTHMRLFMHLLAD